jgi:hypothetical protein
MNNDMHARAEALITQECVEGISAVEQQWLVEHLRECQRCTTVANATSQALRALRSISISVPRELASRTQFRVRLRAQQLDVSQPRWRLVYAMCGASWVAGAATAPYVWRGLAWVGHHLGLPNLVWELGFGVWWALPAIVAAGILFLENAGQRFTRASDNVS